MLCILRYTASRSGKYCILFNYVEPLRGANNTKWQHVVASIANKTATRYSAMWCLPNRSAVQTKPLRGVKEDYY